MRVGVGSVLLLRLGAVDRLPTPHHHRKQMELPGTFGGGLVFLGFGFIIMDLVLIKLLRRIYPDPEYWNEELNFPTLSPEEQRSFPRRKRFYQAAISHRFRKWGISLCLLGALLV